MNNIISVKNLSFSYYNKKILDNITLNIEKNSFTAIIGPNGGGKSTFIQCLLGFLKNQGEVLFNKKNIKHSIKKISYVAQKKEIDWNYPINVFDLVLMGRYIHKGLLKPYNKLDKEKTLAVLKTLEIDDLKNKQISELSGGQQQRTFLARALNQESDIIILDEPFTGIDSKTEKLLVNILQDLQKKDKTILAVHHDLKTVREYFSHVILLNKKLIDHGRIDNTFYKENIDKTFSYIYN